MDAQFKELGLKVKLDGGKFYLLEDFIVSEEGKALSSQQAKMLRLLDIRNDEFKIKIQAYYEKSGQCKIVDTEGFTGEKQMDEEYDGVLEI